MFFRKLALLGKIEGTYAVDPVATGAANAILARNVNVTPLEMEVEARELYLPYLGNQSGIVTAFYGSLDFEVEIAGASAAGTVPAYGPLLRSCSLAEAISAGVSVTYTPVSSGYESVALYFYLDGVLHKFLGSRGSVSASFTAKQVPLYKFAYKGLFQAVTDAALPTAVYTGFVKPLAVNKANTPTFTLHTFAAVMKSFSIDMANSVMYRNLVNYEGVDNVDREPAGSAVFESTLMATKNWFDIAKLQTTGALNLIHGVTAGNIVQIQAPVVEIQAPKYDQNDGIVMLNCGLVFKPNTGNDEFTIVVK